MQWEAAFEAFVARPDPWNFLLAWARDSRCLPVYCDWTHAFGVNIAGRVVVSSTILTRDLRRRNASSRISVS